MSSTSPGQQFITGGFLLRVLLKAAVLFIALNAAYATLNPLPALGSISVYNSLVPGRQRLPFGENPDESYNLSLYQLDAMFASHTINLPKAPDEYRVIVIGDSSVWGILLRPEQTLAGQIDAATLYAPDGRHVRVYNLGYPTISVTKDLLILARAMRYQPDLIVWPVTLEAMPYGKQLSSPIVQNNAAEVRGLIGRWGLSLNPHDPELVDPTWLDRTILGRRRDIADVLRLNLYGVDWAATGIDQVYPANYTPLQKDFEQDDRFYDLRPPLTEKDIALEVLDAGARMVGNVPILFVNEPIFISTGTNSDIRYNFYYPRWAYDDYRRILTQHAQARGWHYLDAWDAVPAEEFTNSAIHVNPVGERRLVDLVVKAMIGMWSNR